MGAALAKKLISKGHKVYTIDNLSTGYEASIPDGVEFLNGNVQDSQLVKHLKNIISSVFSHSWTELR